MYGVCLCTGSSLRAFSLAWFAFPCMDESICDGCMAFHNIKVLHVSFSFFRSFPLLKEVCDTELRCMEMTSLLGVWLLFLCL